MMYWESSESLGDPKTWLSELLNKKDDIKDWIEAVEDNVICENFVHKAN